MIAGIVIKRPILHDWRKLFILFFIVYLIGGIVYVLWASAVPEKWATLQALEQDRNESHSKEETVPMQETQQHQQSSDETDEIKHIDA